MTHILASPAPALFCLSSLISVIYVSLWLLCSALHALLPGWYSRIYHLMITFLPNCKTRTYCCGTALQLLRLPQK
jgi:hypothetical protein